MTDAPDVPRCPPLAGQRCGTCRHYQPFDEEEDFGDCLWACPVPMWVENCDRSDSIMADEGRSCRTWKARDEQR